MRNYSGINLKYKHYNRHKMKYITIIFILYILTSCHFFAQNARRTCMWCNREIILPSGLPCKVMGRDTTCTFQTKKWEIICDKQNHLPDDVFSQTLLLNENNKVILTGKPTPGSKLWKLYKKQSDNKLL